MKDYKFTMKDKYDGSLSTGIVSGVDWKEAWAKLTPLMKAGHKIIDIYDADDVLSDNMPEEEPEEDILTMEDLDPNQLFKVSFLLCDGNPINLIVSTDLLDRINTWFKDEDDSQPPTISLLVDHITIITLDRAFVGALMVAVMSDEEMEEFYKGDDEENAQAESGVNESEAGDL